MAGKVCPEHFKSSFVCFQIPKFIVTQVRQQNAENQRKQNRERAVRKLLKKITTEKSSDKTLQEVRSTACKQPLKVVSSGVIAYVSLHLWNTNPLSICKQSGPVTLWLCSTFKNSLKALHRLQTRCNITSMNKITQLMGASS